MIFASRGGVGVANKALGETAAPALPGRPAISLAKQQLLLRKETHHQRARLGDLLTPGVARVNEKKGVVSKLFKNVPFITSFKMSPFCVLVRPLFLSLCPIPVFLEEFRARVS